MSNCPTCRPVACLRFGDFTITQPTDVLFQNAAQNFVVNCPSGSTPVVMIPAGVVGFVLTFALGQPPYPDLTLNCTGGMITVPVPANITPAQLMALINGLINQCAQQVATQIGCFSASYLNTQQLFQPPCSLGAGKLVVALGPPNGIPNGVGIDSTLSFIVVSGGTITSTVSQADANGKALQLAQEMYQSGQILCTGGP